MTTFYRSVITLEVMSDCPLDELPLEVIIAECNEGDMVMGWMDIATTQIDRPRLDLLLTLAGSDPSFFSPDDE